MGRVREADASVRRLPFSKQGQALPFFCFRYSAQRFFCAAAIRRRAFGRALRITGTPDPAAVVEHVEALAPPGREQVAKNMSTP